MNLQPTPKLALLARGEEHIAETRWFEMGLHDCPDAH